MERLAYVIRPASIEGTQRKKVLPSSQSTMLCALHLIKAYFLEREESVAHESDGYDPLY